MAESKPSPSVGELPELSPEQTQAWLDSMLIIFGESSESLSTGEEQEGFTAGALALYLATAGRDCLMGVDATPEEHQAMLQDFARCLLHVAAQHAQGDAPGELH